MEKHVLLLENKEMDQIQGWMAAFLLDIKHNAKARK